MRIVLPRNVSQLVKVLLFAFVLLGSSAVRESSDRVVNQAILWLPTGVGVAGLWLLGASHWWVIALCTFAQRLLIGYGPSVALPAAMGSSAEALLGVLVLQRLDFKASLNRLSDVRALFLAAALAPLGSILFSWIGRAFVWTDPAMPFYSGWDGWWRMNALGALVVIPPLMTWFGTPRNPLQRRAVAIGALLAAGTTGVLLLMMTFAPPGIRGVLLLNLGLPIALYASVRLGQLGAASIGGLSAIVVAVAASHGIGPFGALPQGDRQLALQLFELAVATYPLVVGALLAERQEAMASSLKHRELLASVNRNVNEGLFRATQDLQLIYANGAFARMFGYEEAGRSPEPADMMTEHARGVRAQLRKLIGDQDSLVNEELELPRRNGSSFWGLVSMTALRGSDGAVLHYDGAIADITARKLMEEQCRQAHKVEAVGTLAGGIAHDFNNLLTAIFGYTESIQKNAGPASPIAVYADGVLNAARRAVGLTRQLLAYSRQQVLSPEVLDLAATLDQQRGALQRLLGDKIQLRIEHASPSSRVCIDRRQLDQVILNLVSNAQDAMATGGMVALTTEAVDVDETHARSHPDLHPGPYVALCVGDSGIGMAHEVQARAFDPFFTTKGQGQGTGLGLSTVYGIVKQSGGAVWLDSQIGAGTRVWIYLPRVEVAIEGKVSTSQSLPTSLNATVLVVEDDPMVRELVCESLRRGGYSVLDAINGAEALKVSRRHHGAIDLVVTDVVMPHMGGRELAGKLLLERPGVKVLFMSGYANDAFDLPAFAEGSVAFIPKPFSSRDLIERARILLHPAGLTSPQARHVPVPST